MFGRSGAAQKDPEEVALTFFQHLTCEDLDAYYYLRWSREKLDQVFSFDGLQHLDDVLKRGRGALLATGHFGAPCAALVGLEIKGFPITHVSREYQSDPSIPLAFRAYSLAKLRRIEQRIGRPLINAIGQDDLPSYEAVLQILKQLRQNQLVSMAIDVSPNLVEDGMTARFLGRPSRFTSNLVRLATQSQTPIIPYFSQRDGRDWSRFRISLRPPILMSGSIQADLQVCVDHLEEVILQRPEQWFIWDSLSFLGGEFAGRRSQVAGSQVAGRRSQVAGRRSQVAGRRSQVAGRRSQVAGRRSQVAGRRSQVAGRRSQVAGRRSQVAGRFF